MRDGRIVRDPFPGQRHTRRIGFNEVGRNIAEHLPAAEQRLGNFDNYISTPDRQITDHAFSGRVDHRFSDSDSVFFRFNYGRFRLDAPQGRANCCLPTPAACGRAVRPRSVHRGHPEHEADDARRSVQLHAGHAARPSSTSSALVMRARSPSRRNRTTGAAPRSRWVFAASTSARSLPACPTSTSRTSPGFGRSGVPARQPVAVPLPDRGCAGLDQGKSSGEVRLPSRRSAAVADDPRQHAQPDHLRHELREQSGDEHGGTGLAELLLGYFNSASRGFLLEEPHFKVVEQAAFVQDDFKVNSRMTVNAGLRYEIFHAPTEKNHRLGNFDFQ